jgi:maltose O-acetyltransferase
MRDNRHPLRRVSLALIGLYRNVEWILLQWKSFLVFGRRVKAHGNFRVDGPSTVTVGENFNINHGVFILGIARITIGDNVTISANAMLLDGGLSLKGRRNPRDRTHFSAGIIIEDNVWIGGGAIVLAGARIGANSVIAAGAVVTSDVPANCLYGGVPARLIRRLES